MKYVDLVQFDPIESVVELRAADKADAAKRLVETFVISDRLAGRLKTIVFPQLQFDVPTDNKGMLIVGNYGTGKSHLMAVISSLAERGELVRSVTHADVKKSAEGIGGRFCVIRAEAPSTQLALRDLVCQRIEKWLADHGVDFTFPPSDEVTSNKEDIQEMMGKFEQKHPDKGLLFVLDELLDYLRGRDHQALIRDLGFLRELGEVCKTSRFRFIAGVQETPSTTRASSSWPTRSIAWVSGSSSSSSSERTSRLWSPSVCSARRPRRRPRSASTWPSSPSSTAR